MKQKIIFRTLLTLYILVFIFIAVIVLSCATNLINRIHPEYWVKLIYENTAVRIIAAIICMLILILSFSLMFARTTSKRLKTKTLRKTESSVVEVAIIAIEQMAQRYMTDVNGVKSSKIHIISKEEGVIINAKLTVEPHISIPELTSQLEEGLKNEIETYTGISVTQVQIVITVEPLSQM
ncbi:MAG: alkaline shock response membrane anchor protein AmaP [Eubacteriales bacterium]